MPCLIKLDMHHTCLCIMPCLCLCIYPVVCFFPVLLLCVISDNVAFVRILSTTSVCLLHGLVLLPCGISGKMIIPSKSLLSLLASCSLFCYAYAAIPTTCYIMPPMLLSQGSNPPCPSKPLFGYVAAFLSPSYSVVSCR